MGILLVAVTLSATVADSLSPYRGLPIFEIQVDAPEGENVDDLLELTDLRPGYLLSTDELHAAIKRLYSLGRFSAVDVFARRVSGTIALRFKLLPIERLGDLSIEGLKHANREELRKALRFRRGAEIDSHTAELISARALDHLEKSGFPFAKATVTFEPVSPGYPRDATLRIEEGKPVRITDVRLAGEPKVDPRLVLFRLESRPGAILNTEKIERDHQKLIEIYRTHGFLTAEADPPEVVRVNQRTSVVFTVRSGPRVSFHISGNTVFADEDLRALAPGIELPLTDQEVGAFAARIRNLYTRIGRFTTEVHAQGYRDPRDGTARYRVEIREGPPMRVEEIRVTGSIAFTEAAVVAQIRTELAQQLGGDGVLDKLVETDRCLLDRSPPICRPPEVPAEDRWVSSIYKDTLETIAGSYRNLGYLNVKIDPPEIEIQGRAVKVRIRVSEGRQTFIRSLAYEGNEAFESSQLLETTHEATSGKPEQAPIQPGAPFSRNGVEDARIFMTRAYRDQGYLYGRVFSEVQLSENGQWADVTYRFDEGPQVRINRVLVRGNRFTDESVILSRISFERGNIYRLEQALSDQRAIAELGVFDSVRVRLIDEERPSEQKDLVAEVTERNRQPIELAPGISIAQGPRLQASYANINLFGTAGQLTILARINRQIFFDLYGALGPGIRRRVNNFSAVDQIERVLQVGYRSPRYVNMFWKPSLRTEVVHERSITLSYAFNSTRLVTGVDLQPLKRLRLSLAPEISLTDLTCADLETDENTCIGFAQDANPNLVTLSEGARRAVQIGPSAVYDGRDNPFFPTTGFLVSGSVVYSIGRSRATEDEAFTPQDFVRAEAAFSRYLPLGETVLAMSVRGGHIRGTQEGVPIFERFFLGGRTSLRGVPERALIAQDCLVVNSGTAASVIAASPGTCVIGRSDSEAPITQGGQNYFLLKTELRVPVGRTASIGLFVDAGNLWFDLPKRNNLTLRTTAGAGLRFNTPVGPLAFDLGFNLSPRRETHAEGLSQLHFSVGVF